MAYYGNDNGTDRQFNYFDHGNQGQHYPSLSTQPNQRTYYNSYQQPPPPPPSVPRQTTHVMIVNRGGQQMGSAEGNCPYCSKNANGIGRYKFGCATWSWAIALFFLTGCCCWIPFVIDDCKDYEVRCASCANVRQVTLSPFCC